MSETYINGGINHMSGGISKEKLKIKDEEVNYA